MVLVQEARGAKHKIVKIFQTFFSSFTGNFSFMEEKNTEKIKEMTIVSPVEDGLQIQPRLLASQPRIQDILSNTRELYLSGIHSEVVQTEKPELNDKKQN